MRGRGFRIMTGLLTVGIFGTIGGVLVTEDRLEVGLPILALAGLRAVFLLRDMLARPESDDED